MRAYLIKVLLRLGSRLPLGCGRLSGRALARLYMVIGGRGLQVARRNLEHAFPALDSAGRAALVRETTLETGALVGEMGRVWLRPSAPLLDRFCRVEGAELVTDALATGRGVLVLAPHLGNWEVLGLHLPSLGETVSMYEPPKLRALDGLVRGARERSGARLVAAGTPGIRELYRHLCAGGIVGLLPDQVPRGANAGANVPFMGVPCYTGSLPIRLLRNTGALPVFGYAERIAGGFCIRYAAASAALYDERMENALAAMNRGIEACVRRSPAQYQWHYKRFRAGEVRAGPDALPDFYAGIR